MNYPEYMHIFKKVLSELLVLDIISNLLKSIGDYIKRLPHDGSWKMVLRKIYNFAKIAPFQLNIFNLIKRLFYVIFIFLVPGNLAIYSLGRELRYI